MLFPAHIERLRLPDEGRIIVISDVHGNLSYLKGLLNKLELRDEDTLVFDGDTMEKGPQSLDTLRFLMELDKKRRCLFVLGNCDYCTTSATAQSPARTGTSRTISSPAGTASGPACSRRCAPRRASSSGRITTWTSSAASSAGASPPSSSSWAGCRSSLRRSTMSSSTAAYRRAPRRAGDGWHLMKNDNFMSRGRRFSKWVIVGHWPVVLYRENVTGRAPDIDRESRIISIDGGCVLKDDGQLNALIIPHNGSEDFTYTWYDPFPVRRVKSAQAAGGTSAYIRWGDNEVEILERGAEFSPRAPRPHGL